uniref:Alpha-ketoglutarate-dependent 2,4-dichlorophenoxyacetate dioxygenase n=1 Tax=Rhizobium rhizogenes TaxID=359 RepID=A0A7S5DSL1_RHIRH|nr:TauD/TfdA family dioxygenase [Rhizobium rhizogenes]QCL09172.1 alpha-ketoglutarate-dependent 2,4-dichlorophenoxyacetate dioxygenase [Rhizobium rhizogenes]QCL09808.1 alpha-ketoglutarate-dependent 2,4-dichlorophenoxyacetate dioxygenase [Rhizobium rhizogenes]
MSIQIKQLHDTFVGEVSGVDLSQVDKTTYEELEQALQAYAVLIFHEQILNGDEQIAFSQRFGPLETNIGNVIRKDKRRLGPAFADISNLDEQNRILPADDRRRLFAKADRLWHTDASFKHVPAKYSFLYAIKVPPEGGETEFADLRAAYDALPRNRRDELDSLIVEHSIFHSRAQVGFTDFSEDERTALAPSQQVLVRHLPETARSSLYIASHASRIIGWKEKESRQLLDELLDFSTRPNFVYQHRWNPGDLVIWDNRCTLHRGRPWDDDKYQRELRRTTVLDADNSVNLRNNQNGTVIGQAATL